MRSGNMFESGLPSTPDVVSFIRVLHDHDDDRIKALLSSAHKALPEGGRLIVAEPMAGTWGSEAIGDAYFGRICGRWVVVVLGLLKN